MKDGYFTLTKVQCEGCRNIIQVPANFARSTDEVWIMAEKIHAATGIICGTPLLSATYVPTLVSDELAKQIDAAIEEARLKAEGNLILNAANGSH